MPSRVRTAGRILDWYARHARPLPWREPGVTPWAILVSEVMLQQTPVHRVLPVWESWQNRWPTPDALADDDAGEAVRAWGRLGYPRRAKRLHEAAGVIRDRHAGRVPDHIDELRALPGVGAYTAAAVAAFAFGQRQVVLDTNVRRLLARIDQGTAFPPSHLSRAETERAERWLPAEDLSASRWAAASMELGALVCTARHPDCPRCPVTESCAWRIAGYPAWDGPERKGQRYAGTDRQCRGTLLAVLRESDRPVPQDRLLAAWIRDDEQARRALGTLLEDGLVHRDGSNLHL
ncbi:MAG: A/G-specific adenine glycosylase [Propioniciclava sp.]